MAHWRRDIPYKGRKYQKVDNRLKELLQTYNLTQKIKILHQDAAIKQILNQVTKIY